MAAGAPRRRQRCGPMRGRRAGKPAHGWRHRPAGQCRAQCSRYLADWAISLVGAPGVRRAGRKVGDAPVLRARAGLTHADAAAGDGHFSFPVLRRPPVRRLPASLVPMPQQCMPGDAVIVFGPCPAGLDSWPAGSERLHALHSYRPTRPLLAVSPGDSSRQSNFLQSGRLPCSPRWSPPSFGRGPARSVIRRIRACACARSACPPRVLCRAMGALAGRGSGVRRAGCLRVRVPPVITPSAGRRLPLATLRPTHALKFLSALLALPAAIWRRRTAAVSASDDFKDGLAATPARQHSSFWALRPRPAAGTGPRPPRGPPRTGPPCRRRGCLGAAGRPFPRQRPRGPLRPYRLRRRSTGRRRPRGPLKAARAPPACPVRDRIG